MKKTLYLLIMAISWTLRSMESYEPIKCYIFDNRSVQYRGVIEKILVRAMRIGNNYFCLETEIKNGVEKHIPIDKLSAERYWLILHNRYNFNQMMQLYKKKKVTDKL